MTTTQQAIIRLIAQSQLDDDETKGISIKDLFEKCVEGTLAHSHKGLKEYLHEAKDHKIVLEKLDSAGNTVLYMPYQNLLLQKIANDKLDDEVEGVDE